MKKDNSKKDLCKGCGLCCIVKTQEGYRPCRWLITYARGEGIHEKPTRCAIYQHRVYSIIGEKQLCHTRATNGYNFPGCPYNVFNPKWEMHPKYKNMTKNV